MADHIEQLLLRKTLHQRRIQDDERLVHPDGAGIQEGALRDEELRDLLHIEQSAGLLMEPVHLGELIIGDTHGGGERDKADRFFGGYPHQFLQNRIEAGNLLQSGKRGPVGGMLPGLGADIRESGLDFSDRGCIVHGRGLIFGFEE
jgi:hypothetical protein